MVADSGPTTTGRSRSSYRPPSPSQARAPRKRIVLAGPPPLSVKAMRVVGFLLLVSSGMAVGGLFLKYTLDAAPSSESTSAVLVHVVGAGAWLVGGFAIMVGKPAAIRMGNALAAGSALVTFGVTIVETSQLIGTGESLGGGFWLEVGSNLVALLAGLIGTLVLARSTTERGLRLRLWTLIPAVIAGAVVVAGYTQSWQRERITSGTAHKTEALKVPGQFDARWEVIAGHIVILAMLVGAPVLATQWRRRRPAGALMVGAVVGFAAFVLPTYITTMHPLERFSASVIKELKQEKLTIAEHLISWYWVVTAGALALAVIGIVMVAIRNDPEELSLPR
jgi:hypothetical protein